MTEPVADATPAQRGSGYLRTTLKHGSIYTLGMILSRMIGFVMIPVYTYVLTPADYGVLEVLSLTTDILGMLVGLGIGIAVMRQYYAVDGEAERHEVVSTAATLLIGMFAVVALAGVALAGVLAPVLLGSKVSPELAEQSPMLVRLAVITLAVGSTIEVPMAVLRARQVSSTVVGVGLVRLTLSLALNIVFVVWLRLGVAGVLLSSLLTALAVGGVLTVRLYREAGLHFSSAIAKRLVVFGAPLIAWNIGSFVLHYSDRFFLRAYDSLDAVGLYSLGYKVAMLVSMFIVGPFSDIWIPKALEIEKREGDGSSPILASIALVYNLVLVTGGFGVALFGGDLLRFAAGAEFHPAADTVPLLALAMVIFGYRNIAQIGALIRGRSDLVAIAATAAAVVVIGLNAALIPRWGVTGAALATIGAFAFEFFLMRRLSERVHPLRVRLGPLLAPIGVGIAVFAAAKLIAPADLGFMPTLALHTVAVATYVATLFATGAIPPDLRRPVWNAIRRPVQALKALRA